MVNLKNWNYSYYTNSQKMKAFVSVVVETTTEVYYAVTLTTEDDVELFQTLNPSLNVACQVLNEKYSAWNFKSAKASGDGCSSCSAH